MSNRTKVIIILVALSQVFLAAFALSLPAIVEALPGRIRTQLPDAISELIITPVPTALPAPRQTVDAEAIVIPVLDLTPTPEPTATAASASPTPETAEATASPSATPTEQPTETPTATPTLTPTPEPLPASHLLEGLRAIGQSFNNCGPANLTMVLNWYDVQITQAEVASVVKPNANDRNVSPWQIEEYVNNNTTLRAIARSNGTLELLKRLVANGFVTVVEKGYDPETAEGWYGHYLTIYGFDDEQGVFHAMDSFNDYSPGPVVEPYEEIEDYWREFNYTFYVVYEPVREEELFAILGTDLLNDLTMWQNAALRAQQELEELEEFPEMSAFAWFNLGTSLTELGEMTGNQEYYQNAAAAFDQALTIGLPWRMLWYQFKPYMAYLRTDRFEEMVTLADTILSNEGGRNVEETYLYKGHALASLGDIAGAREAYQQALVVNENFGPAQTALDSLPGS